MTSVIAGGQTVQHFTQNAAAVAWDLTPEMSDQIEQILAPYDAKGAPGPERTRSGVGRQRR